MSTTRQITNVLFAIHCGGKPYSAKEILVGAIDTWMESQYSEHDPADALSLADFLLDELKPGYSASR